MKVGPNDILSAALALVEDAGIDALNMRALAARIGVQASALYWHIGGKAELLSLMAETFYVRAFDAARGETQWREWLLGYGRALRQVLLQHRDAAQICARAEPVGTAAQSADMLAAPLVAAGLARHNALVYQSSVISLALGWAIYEQSSALRDHLRTVIDFDESFTVGLTAMVSGFPERAAG